MMRLFYWLLSLPIFVGLIVFALQNRAQVTISFWPMDAQATLPLSILSVGLLIVGFIGGSLLSTLLNLGAVFENKRLKKEVAGLNAKLEAQKTVSMPCSGPTILSHGRYQPVPPQDDPKPQRRGWFRRTSS